MFKRQRGNALLGGFVIGLTLWAIAAWFTHVVVCIKTASWGFLIAGAIMFPIGLVHGTGVWFGAW